MYSKLSSMKKGQQRKRYSMMLFTGQSMDRVMAVMKSAWAMLAYHSPFFQPSA